MNRHDFLSDLHRVLQPKSYLEIGVQHGHSLRLATCPAIGVDPHAKPGLEREIPNATIYRMTSDEFFTPTPAMAHCVTIPSNLLSDLVFIDGDHLIEQVCRDFENVERWCCHKDTLVVLDDVLPYGQGMGSRTPCQGDWSGDAWKIWYALGNWRDLDMRLVDVAPAGLLLVRGFENERSIFTAPLNDEWITDCAVPEEVLARSWAVSPDEAIEWAKSWLPEGAVQPGGPPLPPGDVGVPLEAIPGEADQDR